MLIRGEVNWGLRGVRGRVELGIGVNCAVIYEVVIWVNDMQGLIPEEMFFNYAKLSVNAIGSDHKNKAVIIMNGEGSQRHCGVNTVILSER